MLRAVSGVPSRVREFASVRQPSRLGLVSPSGGAADVPASVHTLRLKVRTIAIASRFCLPQDNSKPGKPMTSKILSAAFLLMGLLLVAECNSATSDERGLQIVSMAKAASGGAAWDRLEIMHDAGRVILETGEVLRYEHWGDLRTLSTRAGSGGGDMIFDGRVAYKCQSASCDSPTKLDSVEMRSAAYLTSFGFFFPARFPAAFQYKGTRADGGVLYDVVEISPTGLASVDIWINHDSHLLSRTVFADGRFRSDLSDYRKVSGVMVPFTEVNEGVTMKSETVKFEATGSVSFSLPTGHQP
jgi:hypothetical protein